MLKKQLTMLKANEQRMIEKPKTIQQLTKRKCKCVIEIN